ncbi:MAG: thiamine phosphate synthase [Muribaculaceae bacterium]|nr:thiamine phosphate synthase [Muribaculaceae bacterium]
MLQYITNTKCGRSIPDQVKAVLEGGCRWIQLRMKDATHDEVMEMAKQIKPLTDEKEAFLIINDYVDICRDVNCTGVHLGKTDMLPSKARLELGPLAVIGVTANTFADIEAVRALDIDYIGMGPFAATSTKENLAPILGFDGISELCNQMNKAEINIAHVAVGGVKLEDVQQLLASGCDGIAVSDAIASAPDMADATRRFCALLPTGD